VDFLVAGPGVENSLDTTRGRFGRVVVDKVMLRAGEAGVASYLTSCLTSCLISRVISLLLGRLRGVGLSTSERIGGGSGSQQSYRVYCFLLLTFLQI
jgi:hypothetical protein